MKFVSKYKEHRIILEPTDRTIDDQRRTIIHRGKKAEFYNYQFNTQDPVIIDLLKNHREYGIMFTSDEVIPSQQEKVQMITGSSSVVNTRTFNSTDASNPPSNVIIPSQEDMDKLIEKKVFDIVSVVVPQVLSAMEAEKNKTKPKKIFTCKICGEQLSSGFAINAHNKTAHL